jgi:hypothetical protein
VGACSQTGVNSMFLNLDAIKYEDFITGEKFSACAQYIHTHYDFKNKKPIQEQVFLYTDTNHIHELLALLSNTQTDHKYVVISHNSDASFSQECADSLPANIIAVFSQNVACKHEKVIPLPIGLENERWFVPVKKKNKMLLKMKNPTKPHNLVYLNASVRTCPAKRTEAYNYFRNCAWCLIKSGKNGSDFDGYLNDIESSFFIISPEGHGIDCHRTWEALYLNRVPVLLKNDNTKLYEKLPVLLVDSWNDITENYLKQKKQEFESRSFDIEMLKMSYWKTMISRSCPVQH